MWNDGIAESVLKKEWILIIRSSYEDLHEQSIKPGRNVLGRDADNDIILHDEAASSKHAEIYYDQDNDTVTIRDLNSTNGTFVNGKRLYKTKSLQHEDQIRVGYCIITILYSQKQSSQTYSSPNARNKVTNELILESIDQYSVLLHDVGQQLVDVPDLNDALTKIAELLKRMIGAEECQIILSAEFEKLKEKGVETSIANRVIDNKSAIIFSEQAGESHDKPGSKTQSPNSMLLVPVLIGSSVAALIFARKSQKSLISFYNSDLHLVLAVSHQVAMSIQRNQVEGKLLHNSNHDSLTNLPNRSLFLDRLAHSISRAKQQKGFKFAVFFFDVDDFKIINDSLGHAVGDKFLVAMADRLSHNVRQMDTVARNTVIARFGGDEFAILLDDIKESRFALAIANRFKDLMSKPFTINGKEIFITVSIGVALSTNNYAQPENILRDADIAMYQAKELGKERVAIYDKAMHHRVLERMHMGTALRQGAIQKEFRLHYQPIISLKSGSIVGFEALLRWYTPDQGILNPIDFMDAIDTAGLVYTTDQWVLQSACRQAVEWQSQFSKDQPLFMSVNLSAKNIKHPNLVENIGRVLQETGLDPGKLWLEITEKVSAANDESVISVLNKLHNSGIQISLDDFGTGYSALNYLARFPIDALKIDRSFIKMIGAKDANLKIIEMIKALASHLGLILIAEGVDNANQIPFLQSINCEYVQGFFYAEPLDSKSAEDLLATGYQW